ncbi:DUF4055 domain-containing protein [Simonsiella muelleri]|uniref:DUF4055 domain-containing protein n=1 Tax=Simonsiella muelleri ATCC 29453 TaxID=641147 RepID=V9H7D6_9NEIS|nr:DUF4055 domain-containing protein [Simonsiella muelleri]AUX61671.1 hypothetical protein BWP33_07565 [Simonsiella muelleri ATCC 29453]EFG29921.1 hypothetical protein HMPREF9021_02240 [Simonsiella muelleri ATCC 29453]UBQ53742.1 DUF4055 domain-containing protein [Simonsiella muelleri]
MTVSRKTKAVTQMHIHGAMIDALLGGTESMRLCGKTYLPQWANETHEAYQDRLATSTLLPVLKETIGQMVGRVFYKDLDTSQVFGSLKDFLPNIDLQNNSLNVFCAAWFADALTKGASFVLVDFPENINSFTRADEKRLNFRPYTVLIKNSDVLGFRYEMRNGRAVCTQFRYRQMITEYDGEFGEREIEQINVHEIGSVRRYRVNEKGETFIHSQSRLLQNGKPLDVIPIVDLVLEKTGFFTGKPPLLELAYLNIKHWQSQSDQDNITHYVRVPLLQYQGQESIDSVVSSAGSLINVGERGNLSYVEHSGAAIAAGVNALEKLENDMQVAGAKLLTRTKIALTDTQARDEAGREVSLLRHYANLLEDSIGRMLDFMAMWQGETDGGNVEISGSIDADYNPTASLDVLLKMNTAGILSHQTLFDEAKKRGLLSPLRQWKNEQNRLQLQGGLNMDFRQLDDEQNPNQ